MLWVDDEIYVLIDGIYKAMGELLIKPRVTGNMEKIPYYICIKYGLDEKGELIDTDEVYVEVDGEKKYFNQVLKTPEGIFLPLDRFIEVYGGEKVETDKDIYINDLKIDNSNYMIMLKNIKNNTKIINRNFSIDIYKKNTVTLNSEISLLSENNNATYVGSFSSQAFNNKIGISSNVTSNTKYTPVLLKYIAEKNGYTLKYNKDKNSIYMLKNGILKKEIFQPYNHESLDRAIVSSELFAISFEDFNNREHKLGDTFEREAEAVFALSSMAYNGYLKALDEVYEVEKVGNRYKIKKAKRLQENCNKLYYYRAGSTLFSFFYKNKNYFHSQPVFPMNYTMDKTKTAYAKTMLAPDNKGVNLIANLERNTSNIEYDENNNITNIPLIGNDVGYGHDYTTNPLNDISLKRDLTAQEALNLLNEDVNKIVVSFTKKFIIKLNQDQINALLSLRYNVGSLASIGSEGEYDTTGKLVPAINRGNWDRAELEALIKKHYNSNKNENNKKGWLDRADKMLDVFFEGKYPAMPIDAVNRRILK